MKECRGCGLPFTASGKAQELRLYCDEACRLRTKARRQAVRRASMRPREEGVCPGCGEAWTREPTGGSPKTYCTRECQRRAWLAGQPQVGAWSEERRRLMDERRQERVEAVEEGLALGLSAEGIASDCGIALPSLVRSLERLGETELLDRLRRRRDGRWVA